LEPGTRITLEGTLTQAAVSDGKVAVRSHHQPSTGAQAGVTGQFLCELSIPIYLKEQMLGVLNVGCMEPNVLSGEEHVILQPIADQVGAVIDRGQLFRKVSDDSKYIHNLLNSIHSVVYTIDRSYRITAVNKAWRDFAVLLGLTQFSEEQSVVGRSLREIVPSQFLWASFEEVLPSLFSGALEYYSGEFEFGQEHGKRTYQISINPMVIDSTVTALVFTSTDITSIKRTEAEIKRRNLELEALNAISSAMGKSLQLEDILREACAKIKEIIQPDVILLYLKDHRYDRLRLEFHLGLPKESASRIRHLHPSASATGYVVSEGKPLFVSKDLGTDLRLTSEGREVLGSFGLKSFGVIPLRSKEKVLGALDVGFIEPHEFTDKDEQFLMLIGGQLGSAVENAQLYAEVRNQVLRLTLLYEVGRGLTGSLDVHTILSTVYEEFSKSIPIDRFTYYVWDANISALKPVLDVGAKGNLSPESFSVVPGDIFSDIMSSARGRLVTNDRDERHPRSMIVAPVKSQQEVAGLFVVGSDTAEAFDESHLRLLESIATLTELALDKASMYVDLVNTSKEIEARNKELDDFTYVVSHDLKEPLISIEGYSKILLKEYEDKVGDEGKEFLGALIQSSVRLKNLIDDLLQLSRLGRLAESTETISVNRVVREVLQDIQFTLKEHNVTVDVAEDLPTVQYNHTQLGIVFRNLISNAVKFNTSEFPRVVISATRNADQYVISVADNGIGIDQKYFDKIFMIFQRLHRNEEYRGTGAGLTIVKKIVENHRGRIWVESAGGKGSTFFFTIPVQG
jgi:PAS domain S-box-containing protein